MNVNNPAVDFLLRASPELPHEITYNNGMTYNRRPDVSPHGMTYNNGIIHNASRDTAQKSHSSSANESSSNGGTACEAPHLGGAATTLLDVGKGSTQSNHRGRSHKGRHRKPSNQLSSNGIQANYPSGGPTPLLAAKAAAETIQRAAHKVSNPLPETIIEEEIENAPDALTREVQIQSSKPTPHPGGGNGGKGPEKGGKGAAYGRGVFAEESQEREGQGPVRSTHKFT